MAKGIKTGGRQKGTPSKRSLFSVAAACERYNCNPFEVMARIAVSKKASTAEQLKAAAELASYLAPKLRAIEHSGPDGGPIQLDADPRELLARKIAELKSTVR